MGLTLFATATVIFALLGIAVAIIIPTAYRIRQWRETVAAERTIPIDWSPTWNVYARNPNVEAELIQQRWKENAYTQLKREEAKSQ
jgi:hypothetical protein